MWFYFFYSILEAISLLNLPRLKQENLQTATALFNLLHSRRFQNKRAQCALQLDLRCQVGRNQPYWSPCDTEAQRSRFH